MTMPTRTEIHPALRRVLLRMGPTRARDVIPEVTAEFSLTQEELARPQKSGKGNQWSNRVQWAKQDLVTAGEIDNSQRGIWALSDAGRQRAEAEANVGPAEPDVTTQDDDDETPIEEPTPPPYITALPDSAETLAAELRQAATDSQHPNRLEIAVAAAMQTLGFDVERISGPGKTDVVADATLGLNRYRIVLDAKSTANGLVGDAQIDWLSIRTHRQSERADYACIVGPGFAGGRLRTHAEEFDACLLTAEELGELVRLHAEQPLSLVELRPLFGSSPLASEALPQVRAAAQERARRLRLLKRLLERIHELNRLQLDEVLAKPDTLFVALVGDPDMRGATLGDVRSALSLLATLGILTPVNGDGYASATSVSGALSILGAMARVGLEADAGVTDTAITSAQAERSTPTNLAR